VEELTAVKSGNTNVTTRLFVRKTSSLLTLYLKVAGIKIAVSNLLCVEERHDTAPQSYAGKLVVLIS
jgi:hypothetical protein